MASSSKTRGEEGTILIRQAEPKYKITTGRKIPSQADPLQQRGLMAEAQSSQFPSPILVTQRRPMPDTFPLDSKLTSVSKPIAVVGASVASSSEASTFTFDNFSFLPSTQLPQSSVIGLSPPNDMNMTLTDNDIISCPVNKKYLTSESTSLTVLNSLRSDRTEANPDSSLIKSSAAASALSSVTTSLLREQMERLKMERDKLRKDLDSQLQVNAELKRLLIASVGDDLSQRVERLAQDRVQLSMDIGGFSKKMSEDYENLDKMSIQADMWRSKYLASRVMVEELGNARAYYSLQCHESQEALQQMLNERHELRTNLLEAYKVLQQVKDAFDPLNSHPSSSLLSTNVLDLSRVCQQLGEAVRFRLLPAHATGPSYVEIDLSSLESSVTKAEQYAHELLSRPSEPPGSLQSGSAGLLPVSGTGSASSVINRYHPHVKHENFSIHCCKCQGDIKVV